MIVDVPLVTPSANVAGAGAHDVVGRVDSDTQWLVQIRGLRVVSETPKVESFGVKQNVLTARAGNRAPGVWQRSMLALDGHKRFIAIALRVDIEDKQRSIGDHAIVGVRRAGEPIADLYRIGDCIQQAARREWRERMLGG